jgi:hypothetical protein
MTPPRIVLGTLGVWRVTHLLHAEDGPFELLARLRAAAATWAIGDVLGCFWCASLWVAAPFALTVRGWRERLLLWPALSAGAIVVQETLEGRRPPVAAFIEDEEVDDGLLRTS